MAQQAIGDDLLSSDPPPISWCPEATVKRFVEVVNSNLLLSNVLMVASAVLLAAMVAVGASGRRYHRLAAAASHLVFLGASTLYLPILSYVVSSVGKEHCGAWCLGSGLDVSCHGRSYLALLLIWTVLVQIVGTNTSAIVAASDHDDQENKGVSVELLARTVWTAYLVFYYTRHGFLTFPHCTLLLPGVDSPLSLYSSASLFITALCLLSIAKIMLRLYAFQRASQSFALGWRNPHLVEGYVKELLVAGAIRRGAAPPPFIVMGEDSQEIEKTPHGYTMKRRNSDMVTVDMVWATNNGDTVLATRPWLKDLCLSFALFKLLRPKFATTARLVESATAFNLVLDVLLNAGTPKRVFKVMEDEISFVLDTYYSSLPTSNFGRLLPVVNIIVSISIISLCLFGCAVSHRYSVHHPRQLFCNPHPSSCKIPSHYLNDDMGKRIVFGNIIYNILPTFSLLVVVTIGEAWEITSYLCSNWIKVAMTCGYITRPSWQRSPRIQRCLGLVLDLRIRFGKSSTWNDRMGQMSLLPMPDDEPKTAFISRLCLFLFFPRIWHVQVPEVVKAAIVDALRSTGDDDGCLSKGAAALRKIRIGVGLLWACQSQSTSDVILAWHISTGIFESRHGAASSSTTAQRTVATCLSRYCVYLMAAASELLPDHRAWSYKAVGRDIDRALAGDQEAGMVARLNERAEHEVVKRGVELGKQLLELASDPAGEEAGWALLAAFWSEMVLYVAPSDSLKAPHKNWWYRAAHAHLGFAHARWDRQQGTNPHCLRLLASSCVISVAV